MTGVLTGEQLGQFSTDAIRQAKIDPDATLAESLDRAQVKQLIAQHGNNLYDPEYRERMGLTQGDFALKHVLFGGQSVGEAPGLKETGSYLPSRAMSMPEYLITNWPSDEGPIPKRLMSQVTQTAKQLDYPGLSSKAKEVVGYNKGGEVLKRIGVSGYNKPKRTPNHPKKSHVVVAKQGDKVKTIRFGQQGVRGAGKNPKSAKDKARKRSYYARHNAQDANPGKLSARYWSHKVKW